MAKTATVNIVYKKIQYYCLKFLCFLVSYQEQIFLFRYTLLSSQAELNISYFSNTCDFLVIQ